MPNRQVIKQWVDALRSGEYTQTSGRLRRLKREPATLAPAGMCCLGVLAELGVKAGVVAAEQAGNVMRYGEETHVLPWLVTEWAGLNNNPFVKFTDEDGEREEPLTILNDEMGLSFPQIADAIEATYLAKSDAGQPA